MSRNDTQSKVSRRRRAAQDTSARKRAASAPNSLHRRHVIVGLLVVLVACAYIYEPVRNLYAATRDEQVLTEKLSELNEENATLQQSIDDLQTRDGIETAARKRGYINQGETALDVEGIKDSSDTLDKLTASYKDKEETPWYFCVLDALFHYTPPSWD